MAPKYMEEDPRGGIAQIWQGAAGVHAESVNLAEPTAHLLRQGRHVVLDGRRVFVHGRGGRPNVVLLHDFPTSTYVWCRVVEQLATNFRCVVPDPVGFGLSDKPQPHGPR